MPSKAKNPDLKSESEREIPAIRVLMIGCGSMGGALLEQWRHNDRFDFTVVSPSGQRRFPEGVIAVRTAAELGDAKFDIIVIGVKPQMIREVLPEYTHALHAGGFYISLAAGFAVESLIPLTQNAPLVRVMPNLPVALGKGVSGLYAADTATADQRALVDLLMGSTGYSLWVDSEDRLDGITAIAGSGAGYAFEIARCWAEAGEQLGFSPQQSRELVLRTLQGAVDMALLEDIALADLRNRVTSKNGTTEAGLNSLNGEKQLSSLFGSTVQAAYARARELR